MIGRVLVVLTVVGVAIALIAAEGAPSPSTHPATIPAASRPASKPATALLLLDDDPADSANKLLADNSRCHVCHMNFMKEELSFTHAKVGVGCAKCHGDSDRHIADESWASGGNGTAPDIIFPADRINAACLKCHDAKLDRDKHKAVLAGTSEKKTCTECHGKHRMAIRKCKWK